MGLSLIASMMLLQEHRYRPIDGTLIAIGHQSVLLTATACDRLLELLEIPKRAGASYELDSVTVGIERERPFVTFESFVHAFSDAEVKILDVSDYERADIVVDLQRKLPNKLRDTADFVLNGSCLDNIFDAAAAIRSMSGLLRSGGRIYHFEQGNAHPTAYLKYSPDWFMDYYAANGYEDCKTYVVDVPSSTGVPVINPDPEQKKRIDSAPIASFIYSFNPYVVNEGGEGYDCSSIEAFSRYEIHCIAEKGSRSTSDRSPIQKHYRTDPEERRRCVERVRHFKNSSRPLFAIPGSEFPLARVPRIDSSEYPEQLVPTAVLERTLVDAFLD